MTTQRGVFYGWIVVATSAVGLFLGAFPIVVFSFAVFFESFAKEFHASRAAVSLVFTIHNLLSGIFAVVIGRIADRTSARNVILPGLAVVATLLLAAEAIGSRVSELYLFYAALGVVAPATTTVPYALVVSRWFDRRRGLALGGMMVGLGLGAVVMPIVAQRLISSFGWRHAFAIVGCIMLAIPVPIVGIFLKNAPAEMGLLPDGASASTARSKTGSRLEGLTWRDTRQSGTFWLLIAVFVLLAASVHACVIHMPQLFADRGATAENAAIASSVVGLALLVGRIGCGYFLDRYFGGRVALVICLGAALGIALLWTGSTGGLALIGAFLVGLGMGAEVDIIAFLMSRYFGLRSLGATVGFAFGAFVVAGGLGPLVMGFAFDRTGSYRVPLAGFCAAAIAAAALVTRLGPYRFGAPPGGDAPAGAEASRGRTRDCMSAPVSTPATPLALLRMTDGLVIHQALCAVATLGIADLLHTGKRSAAELASALHINEDALYRALRFLSGQGVFRETGPRTFVNTPLTEYLRSDVPGSIRPVLIFRGSRYYFSPFTEFLYSLQTGIPARDKVLEKGAFEYLRASPQEERVFDDAMTAISALWAPAVAEAYDFGRWETLTDVGGGNGALLAAILQAHPALQGVLADAPSVVERARRREFLSGELAARTRFEPCDFFHAIPSGSRAYVMKNIIHDWNDAQAREILRNCRRAVPDDGVLVLIEYCLGDDNTPSLGKMVDLVMLAITGGKERTAEEHRVLLANAGFRLNRTIPVSEEITIVEALPDRPGVPVA
jgi:MFS family permease